MTDALSQKTPNVHVAPLCCLCTGHVTPGNFKSQPQISEVSGGIRKLLVILITYKESNQHITKGPSLTLYNSLRKLQLLYILYFIGFDMFSDMSLIIPVNGDQQPSSCLIVRGCNQSFKWMFTSYSMNHCQLVN